MVLKAFKLRLYPNKTQRNQIHVNFGCARFVWNQMLNMHIERYKNNKKAIFRIIKLLKRNTLFQLVNA